MNKNVMVIGGGPCGLEASAQLHKMGYNVILIEKEKQLGGHLAKWDRLFPEGIEAKEVLQPLVDNINGVKYFLDTEVVSINLLDKEYNVILSNGITVLSKAVLMTSGFDLFPAEKKEEYGYGIYDRVITNADLEKFFATGKDPRVVKNPKRIGFVHCVGSRDEKAGNRYCSKVCCATAVKQACEMKALFPDAEIFCFYMDLRMFGRGYEDMYLKAQKDYGIRFIRGFRVSGKTCFGHGRGFFKRQAFEGHSRSACAYGRNAICEKRYQNRGNDKHEAFRRWLFYNKRFHPIASGVRQSRYFLCRSMHRTENASRHVERSKGGSRLHT